MSLEPTIQPPTAPMLQARAHQANNRTSQGRYKRPSLPVFDIFTESEAQVKGRQKRCASRDPGSGVGGQVIVHDLTVDEISANPPKPRRLDCLLDDLLNSEGNDVSIRIIFLDRGSISLEGIQKLGSHHSIPSVFWGSSSNGTFGCRNSKAYSNGGGTIHSSWLEILTKPTSKHAYLRWYRPTFFLKWHQPETNPTSKIEPGVQNKVSLLCLDYSNSLRKRFAAMMEHTDARLVLQDPYLLYVLIISEWHQWNADIFESLRELIANIEYVANNPDGNFEPNFPELHDLGRETSQATEVCQASINVLILLMHEHERLFEALEENNEVYERTRSTLETMLVEFKGTLARCETLEKRLTNMINLAFNVVAQRDSKVSVQIGKATQSDSTSMRSIAIVTLVFLPATAIGTLFSMPFFSLSVDGITVSSKFWLFWIIVIPVTVVTIGVWYVFGGGKRFSKVTWI